MPFGGICNWECIFEELGVAQDSRRFLYEDKEWSQDLKRRYNDLSEKIVGRRLLGEQLPDPTRAWPEIKPSS